MNRKIVKNAAWIIGCRLAEAVLHLLILCLTARCLGPAGYGVISYAASVTAFAVPVMQLGVRNILIKELVDKPMCRAQTLGTALCLNLLSALLCVAGITAFVCAAAPGQRETVLVCGLYSLSLVFQAAEVVQYWFQERLLSKYVSLSMLAAYAVMSGYQLLLLAAGRGVVWFALAEPLRHCVTAAILAVLYHRCADVPLRVSAQTCKELLSGGRYFFFSNLMIVVMTQMDRILLRQMAGDAVTGYYSAAVTCANLSNFVFLAIVDSARPVLLQKKQVSPAQFEQGLSLLYAAIGGLSLLQCVGCTLFAPWIIRLLYGAAYAPAAGLLCLSVWHTLFAHLGLVRDVWILSEEKQHLLWRINLLGAAASAGLNLVLIPRFHGPGAAVTLLATQFWVNIGAGMAEPTLRRSHALMMRGWDLRWIKAVLKGEMQR